ncbi:amidohydrolase [Paraburkholderia youngii]
MSWFCGRKVETKIFLHDGGDLETFSITANNIISSTDMFDRRIPRNHQGRPTMESTLQGQLKSWRQYLHQHPETGFEEVNTSDYVANILRTLGLEVHRGIGGTGLVANLTAGDGKRVIGLRADMDALNIAEQAPDREHASRTAGKMHACGHDGHMSMILGAARLLAERRDFNGTVRFIFQPAEEHGRGAKAMMADGLFKRFPVDAIFGAHNMPGMRAGTFATRAGGIMASEDNFVIHIKGRGTHAARPHMGVDPIVIASQIVMALQTVVSRNLDPSLQAVISCTEFITDGLRNVIPSNVIIKGDTRSYSREAQTLLETRMREVCEGICRTLGADCTFEYTHEFAPTVNSEQFVGVAVAAARNVAGSDGVDANIQPMMISEDFGAFLQVVPGNFIFIGNGDSADKGGIPLHNATYDFNDDILLMGARYFAEIARLELPVG